jgi:hypothetical protein
VHDLSPYSGTHPRIIFVTFHGSRKSRDIVYKNLAANEDGKQMQCSFVRTVDDWTMRSDVDCPSGPGRG